MKKGCFVTFEGIDGCGKSTQAKLFAERCGAAGYQVVATREPGGTAIAEKIRSLLIDPAHSEMGSECELLLYLAARAQHLREKIEPAVADGAVVICDRFQDATFAYQGFGRGLPLELLQSLNAFATGGNNPDLTFIIDVPVETAFARMSAMKKKQDRLEAGGETFFRRIREGYLSLAMASPDRIQVIDGTASVEVIAEQVYSQANKCGFFA
ncbi:MAG: dTMP kinase [Chitinispirillaceae bacterium]|nr:dTMP kinase [Chitinispirillaceae bacterium]